MFHFKVSGYCLHKSTLQSLIAEFCKIKQQGIVFSKEELHLKPKVKEFTNDQALITEVQELTARGVDRTDIYVLTHDADRTNRLADNANINTIGIEEEGIGTAVGNIFRKKEDDLREKLQNIRDNCF